MESVTTEKFRKAFNQLPELIKEKTRKAYQIWKIEPYHPSLAFKQVSIRPTVYSVRIGMNYRAQGIMRVILWFGFWIGSREDYNNLIKQM